MEEDQGVLVCHLSENPGRFPSLLQQIDRSHLYNPIANFHEPSSRPPSYHLESVKCVGDNEKPDGYTGEFQDTGCENNFYRKLKDLSESQGDISTPFFSSERKNKRSGSMGSVLSSETHKSNKSLQSEFESGKLDVEPVTLQINICRTVNSFEKQREYLRKNKSFCWPVCCDRTCSLGVALLLTGCLIIFGFWSFTLILTKSIEHVEGKLPSYVSSITMILCGGLTILLSKIKHKLLITSVLVLSFVCTVFCVINLVYLITVETRLRGLRDCSFDIYDKICSCSIKNGENIQLFRFSKNMNCGLVKQNLRELVYGVSVLFGVGFVISIATAVSASYLLYKETKKSRTREALVHSFPTNTATTQTQESSFTTPTVTMLVMDDPIRRSNPENRTVHGANNFSVGTQTPIFMMPVAQLEQNSDYGRSLLVDGRDDPPPTYSDAIASRFP